MPNTGSCPCPRFLLPATVIPPVHVELRAFHLVRQGGRGTLGFATGEDAVVVCVPNATTIARLPGMLPTASPNAAAVEFRSHTTHGTRRASAFRCSRSPASLPSPCSPSHECNPDSSCRVARCPVIVSPRGAWTLTETLGCPQRG